MENHGFLRITAVSPEMFPGDLERNVASIIAVAEEAKRQGSSLLVLPELCITSASYGDLFMTDRILSKAEAEAIKIAEITGDGDLCCIISFPLRKEGRIYSVSAFAAGGDILGIVPLRANNPKKRSIFSEYEGEDTVVRFGSRELPFGKGLLFRCKDDELSVVIGKDRDPDSIAFVYVYPDTALMSVSSYKNTCRFVEEMSRDACCSAVYCSAGEGESTADGVFSGQCIIAEDGKILSGTEPFARGEVVTADVDLKALSYRKRMRGCKAVSEHYTEVSFSLHRKEQSSLKRKVSRLPFLGEKEELKDRCNTAFEIQSRGLASRMEKIGSRKAVLGISGGLDSTLALLVSVRAAELLGGSAEDVLAVSMPCFGTSDRTKNNAQKLCEALGVDFRLIDITDAVKQHLTDIGHDLTTADVAYENAQARERTQVLMDLANMENGLVVGTGDMSEAALGWCTYNGDHMSMYNVNCSLTKTLIRAVVSEYADSYGNDAVRSVLGDIIATPVSPELKPAVDGEIAQKTEDIIGPYEVHDFILYHFLKDGCDPEKILYLASIAFDGEYEGIQLKNWIGEFFRRFFRSQFKRSCVPDGPVIGSVNLSVSGWDMPSDLSGRLFDQS